MKDVIIIGCGSHAAELVDYIEYINKYSAQKQYNIIGLMDVTEEHYHHYGYNYPYLGDINKHIVDAEVFYLIGIGNLTIRTKVLQEFKLKNAKFTGIIHPTALISDSSEIGLGTVVSHNVSIGPKAIIGDFNVINSRCTIGHDSKIGDNNFLSPQVALGGSTVIGANNLLGTNSCTIPDIEIGNNNKIMAGMVITNKVHDNETVFYRYKEKLIVRNQGIA